MLRSLFRGLKQPPPAAASAVAGGASVAAQSLLTTEATAELPPAAEAMAKPLPAAAAPARPNLPAPDAAAAFDPYQAAGAAEARGDLAGAEAILRTHCAACPDDASAVALLGGLLYRCERLDEAASVMAEALGRFPAAAPLLLNYGRVAQSQMRIATAISCYRRAPAVEPGLAMARYLLALQLLLVGDYPEGFLLMRARNQLGAPPPSDWPRNIPLWQGESLTGQRLLIWLDWGGLGDELQFARYIELVRRRHGPAELVLGCSAANQRLLGLLPGVSLCTAGRADLDYQVPLFELPVLFGTTVDNVPLPEGYLKAAPADVRRWGERLAVLAPGPGLPGLRIGLCWSSGFWGGRAVDSGKAIPLTLLARLADLPGARFISLQKGEARAELPCPGLHILDFDADLNDMADTAALIENLDVVVSVDTAVAHLAGALGKPVLMMLKWESGLLWLLERDTSPWYASMRVIRQAARQDWEGVARRVHELLLAWPAQGPGRAAPGAAVLQQD